MRVNLIQFTGKDAPDEKWAAANLLIFTKSTRLTMAPGLVADIAGWTEAKKLEELAYMANTIPSSWEMVDYVFLVEGVSRAFTHQAVRTRNASYAQQTMRVLNMGEYEYVMTPGNKNNPAVPDMISKVNRYISAAYKAMIALGQAPEDARGILPTNISTNIVCKYNLRTMSELCRSRTGGRTQNEYQAVINAMADAVLAVHPWAEQFLFPAQRDHFAEIEAFAQREYGGDLIKKGELLKIVDALRKGGV